MRLLCILSILITSPAYSAPVADDGDLLDPAGGPAWTFTPGVDDDLPARMNFGDRRIGDITVHRGGVVLVDGADVDVDRPTTLAEIDGGALIAPFWAPLQGGACPDGDVQGDVRRADTENGIRFSWHDVPAAGCPASAGSATFSVELFLDEGHVTAIEFRYENLPYTVVEPRAGYRVQPRDRAGVAFELFPDVDGHARRGRAKLLVDGSSDGEAGAWTIELDRQGEVLNDPDRDGRRSIDNCERDFNPLQENLDGDRRGDACDTDVDGDAIENDEDNCPHVFSADQSDLDRDGLGAPCDPDDDGDGIPDILDLCPRWPDAVNLDLDGDGLGDVCDPDPDGDDAPDLGVGRKGPDLCPLVFDRLGGDRDRDGIGDACDLVPDVACVDCRWQRDEDGDRITDPLDVCPWAPDPLQRDEDGDGLGDACDPDRDGDGVLDVVQVHGICVRGGCDFDLGGLDLRLPGLP